MKKTLTSVAAMGALALAATSAHASDGTITFNGEIMSQTCTINIGGGGNTATVTLPPVSASALAQSGNTAGYTGFTIALSNCSNTGTTDKALAYFEAGATVDPTSGRLLNTLTGAGDATNVDLQLLDSANNAIAAGQSTQSSGAMTAITNGAATLSYGVQYYATGAATAGQVSSQAAYSITYQ